MPALGDHEGRPYEAFDMTPKQDYRTVHGKRVRRQDFAYAPACSEASEWKLAIDDDNINAAMDTFAHAEIPAEERRAVAERIANRAEESAAADRVKLASFRKHHLSGGQQKASGIVAVKLALAKPAAGVPSLKGGQLYEHAICVPGAWVKGGQHFSITPADLEQMAANFEKRKNDMVVVDYEHASEQPEVSLGGPVPAAGWIHRLTFNGVMKGLIEWTPLAIELINSGQYRFFSPSIDWGATDKETGEPQGATLTSGALTNHPFLEELPPIMLSDASDGAVTVALASMPVGGTFEPSVSQTGSLSIRGTDRVKDSQTERLRVLSTGKGERIMANTLGMKCSADGTHEVFDGDEILGEIPDGELKEYARRHLGMTDTTREDGEGGKQTMGELLSELGIESSESEAVNLDEVKALLARGRKAIEEDHAGEARRLLLSECVQEGVFNGDRAMELAEQNKIRMTDLLAAQRAEKAVVRALAAGKLLSGDRGFFFKLALAEPKSFNEWVQSEAAKGGQGQSNTAYSGHRPPVDQEVETEVRKLQASDKTLSYAKAMRTLFRNDSDLERRYRSAHRQQPKDGSAPEEQAEV